MIEYNLEAELKRCIKSMHSGYIPKKDADHIRGVMEKALEWIIDPTAPESPDGNMERMEYRCKDFHSSVMPDDYCSRGERRG